MSTVCSIYVCAHTEIFVLSKPELDSAIDLSLIFLIPTLVLIKHFINMYLVQGGSNMTGTNCDLFTHNQSRSYLNHLVHPI